MRTYNEFSDMVLDEYTMRLISKGNIERALMTKAEVNEDALKELYYWYKKGYNDCKKEMRSNV